MHAVAASPTTFVNNTQIDLRKAREPEIATFDDKSTSSGIAEPMRDVIGRQEPGGRRDGNGDNGLFFSSWKLQVC